MTEVVAGVRYIVGFYWAVVRFEVRETWRALPGPWWVKLLIIGVCAAIPGCLDEIALVAALKLCRSRRARKAVAA